MTVTVITIIMFVLMLGFTSIALAETYEVKILKGSESFPDHFQNLSK